MGKWGISNYSHVINFRTEKEPKMKFFDFGAFQINGQMPSHDEIIFHMRFGAFHITPRIAENRPSHVLPMTEEIWIRVEMIS